MRPSGRMFYVVSLFFFWKIFIISIMNNTENQKKNKQIATLGITLALVVVLQALAEIIQKFGLPISFALGLIPVFVVAEVYGVKFGAISGGVFGIVSLLIALIYSSAIPMYAVAINPLVSVLPRILCGTVCALVYKGLMNAVQKSNKERSQKQSRAINFGVGCFATICGVITNTILFLSMFLAFAHGKNYDGLVIDFKWLLSSVVAINTVVELVLFAVIVPAIVVTINVVVSSKKEED